MFTIDLLKGQGKPKLRQRGNLLLVALAMILPVILFLFMTGQYVTASINLPMHQKMLQKQQKQADSEIIPVESEIELCEKYLKELEQIVSQQVQWSPVMIDLVENLPDSLIIDSIKNRETSYTVKETSKADSAKKVKVRKFRNTLELRLISRLEDVSYDAIQNYVKKLTDIGLDAVIKNQGTTNIRDEQMMFYQVECVIEKE